MPTTFVHLCVSEITIFISSIPRWTFRSPFFPRAHLSVLSPPNFTQIIQNNTRHNTHDFHPDWFHCLRPLRGRSSFLSVLRRLKNRSFLATRSKEKKKKEKLTQLKKSVPINVMPCQRHDRCFAFIYFTGDDRSIDINSMEMEKFPLTSDLMSVS